MNAANRRLLELERHLDLLANEQVELAAADVREWTVANIYGDDIAGPQPVR